MSTDAILAQAPPLVYVRWLDASYQEGEHEVEKIDWRCELHYVGWLVKESEEAVTLSLELPMEGRTRDIMTILKRNIVEMRTVKFGRAFAKPRKKRVGKVEEAPAVG